MSNKEMLICIILEKLDILTRIEINHEMDKIDVEQDLFKSYNEYKDFCKNDESKCNCGKKLRGLERP